MNKQQRLIRGFKGMSAAILVGLMLTLPGGNAFALDAPPTPVIMGPGALTGKLLTGGGSGAVTGDGGPATGDSGTKTGSGRSGRKARPSPYKWIIVRSENCSKPGQREEFEGRYSPSADTDQTIYNEYRDLVLSQQRNEYELVHRVTGELKASKVGDCKSPADPKEPEPPAPPSLDEIEDAMLVEISKDLDGGIAFFGKEGMTGVATKVEGNATPKRIDLVIRDYVVTGLAEPIQYTWDMGDGTTLTGKTAWHTYNRKGELTVTMTVTWAGTYSIESPLLNVPSEELPTVDGIPVSERYPVQEGRSVLVKR